MSQKITIDPAVALNELTIDHAYSRDRRLFLANELNLAQQEIKRLNAVILQLQESKTPPMDTTEVDNGHTS